MPKVSIKITFVLYLFTFIGSIVIVNAQVEKMFGYNRTELIGQPVEKLIPERFRETHPALREEFFSNPTVRSMGGGRELFGRRKDGSEFPVEIGLNPINDQRGLGKTSRNGCPFMKSSGELEHPDPHMLVLAAIVDITERKKLEENFRQVVESAPNGVIVLHPTDGIQFINTHTERIFGWTRAELFAKPLDILIPNEPNDGDSGMSSSTHHFLLQPNFITSKSADTPNAIQQQEIFGVRKNGEKFLADIGINYVNDYNMTSTSDGRMIVISVMDVTERKRLEDECKLVLQRERDAAEREAQARAALLAKMSHEIRTPLTGILGCLEVH